jgi:hypothetical protein
MRIVKIYCDYCHHETDKVENFFIGKSKVELCSCCIKELLTDALNDKDFLSKNLVCKTCNEEGIVKYDIDDGKVVVRSCSSCNGVTKGFKLE